MDTLLYNDAFFHFTPYYLSNHTVDKDFKVDDAVMASFKQFLTTQNIPFTDADITSGGDWLKTNIRATIIGYQDGETVRLKTLADWDPMIQKAITYLPEAQALEDTAHKVLAEKAEARTGVNQ